VPPPRRFAPPSASHRRKAIRPLRRANRLTIRSASSPLLIRSRHHPSRSISSPIPVILSSRSPELSLVTLQSHYSTAARPVCSSRLVSSRLTVSSTSSDTITLADGRSQKAAGVLSSVSVAFGSYSDHLDFTVTDLFGYDLILGMPWLVHYNPVIDWRGATVSFVDQHCRACVLRRIATGVAPWRSASSSSPSSSPSPPSFSAARSSVRPSSNIELNVITTRELERSHRKGLIEFACLVYPQLVSDELVVSTVSASPAPPPVPTCQPRPTSSGRSYAQVASSTHPGHALNSMVGHPSHSGGSLSSLVHPSAGSVFPMTVATAPTHQTCTDHSEKLIPPRTHHVQALGVKEPHLTSDGVTCEACSRSPPALGLLQGSTTYRTCQTCTDQPDTFWHYHTRHVQTPDVKEPHPKSVGGSHTAVQPSVPGLGLTQARPTDRTGQTRSGHSDTFQATPTRHVQAPSVSRPHLTVDGCHLRSGHPLAARPIPPLGMTTPTDTRNDSGDPPHAFPPSSGYMCGGAPRDPPVCALCVTSPLGAEYAIRTAVAPLDRERKGPKVHQHTGECCHHGTRGADGRTQGELLRGVHSGLPLPCPVNHAVPGRKMDAYPPTERHLQLHTVHSTHAHGHRVSSVDFVYCHEGRG
jgi:hypothetical protein